MSKKDVSAESFSEMWKETEAELLSEGSVDDTDNVVNDSPADGGGQSEVNDGKPSVLGALMEEDSQPDDGTVLVEVPGFGSYTVEEIKAGMMKDRDYRQKTEDLARQREALKDAEMLWDALQKDPVETVKKLAYDIQSGQIKPTVSPTKSGVDAGNIDEIVAQKVKEALESNDSVKEIRTDRVMRAVNVAFESIEQEEGVTLNQADRAFVLQKAQELGTTDLRFVFNGLYREAERLNSQKDNARNTSTVSGTRNETVSATKGKADRSLLSFAEAAAEALEASGLKL